MLKSDMKTSRGLHLLAFGQGIHLIQRLWSMMRLGPGATLEYS